MYDSVISFRTGFLKYICGKCILRNQYKSGSVFIETVYRSESKFRINCGKEVSDGIALMLYGRVYRYSGRFIENYEIFVFESYRDIESRIRYEKFTVI